VTDFSSRIISSYGVQALNQIEKISENEWSIAFSGPPLSDSVTVRPAREEDQPEILAFLNEQPWYSFGMLGYIYSNGLLSPANRGIYYLCLDNRQNFEGVGLIGYNTLFDARSERAIRAFAQLAYACNETYLILGEDDLTTKFWHYYTADKSI